MTASGRDRPRLRSDARTCPRHPARGLMTYDGPGTSWPHLWLCPQGCVWGATSVAAPLVAGLPGYPRGNGYLTWEQWRVFLADDSDRTWEEKIRAARTTTA